MAPLYKEIETIKPKLRLRFNRINILQFTLGHLID